MKKITTVFIVILIVFNLILTTMNLNTVVASTKGISTEAGYKEWDNTGKTKVIMGGSEKTVKSTSTQTSVAAVSSNLSDLAMILPWVASNIMTKVVRPQYIDDIDNITNEDIENFKNITDTEPENIDRQWVQNVFKKFSILSLVLGYYDVFDIYYFDDVDEAYQSNVTFNNVLKEKVASIYSIMRSIALIFSVISLVYIGIRMAISTVSDDKAKYKKLLRSWLIGFVLIFILHYISIFILEVSKLIQQLIVQVSQNIEIKTDFEYNIINRISTNYTDAKGFSGFYSVIVFWMLVYYQVKFFIMYMYRSLEIAFLIIVAPLITVTYSIDKSVDGRSQVFNSWSRELISEIFLQNLHCIAYLVFVVSAGNIALKSPIIAIIFFASLSRVEKVVKNIFKIQGKSLKDIKVPFFNK